MEEVGLETMKEAGMPTYNILTGHGKGVCANR